MKKYLVLIFLISILCNSCRKDILGPDHRDKFLGNYIFEIKNSHESIGSDSAGNPILQRWSEEFVSAATITKSITADSCIDITFDDGQWNLVLEVDSVGALTYNGEYTYFGVRNLSGSIYPDNTILFGYWTKCGVICSNNYTFIGHKQN